MKMTVSYLQLRTVTFGQLQGSVGVAARSQTGCRMAREGLNKGPDNGKKQGKGPSSSRCEIECDRSDRCWYYLSIYLSVCLSICLCVSLSIYLSVCLSVYLSVCLSIYLSIYKYMYGVFSFLVGLRPTSQP